MAISIFGFEFKRRENKNGTGSLPALPSFVAPENDDGAVRLETGGIYGTYVDLDGTVRSEVELINRYRQMAEHPEIDQAVDEVTNEALVQAEDGDIVEIDLDDLAYSDNIKDIIRNEFLESLQLLEFKNYAYEVFRHWYIDGRIYYHAIIDPKHPEMGVQELRYIDPRKIRKVREIKKRTDPATQIKLVQTPKEYYLYNDKGFFSQEVGGSAASGTTNGTANGVRIAKDSIVQITSGITSVKGDMILSYLHKAIKPLNQLRTMEDSLVIYRISRAPERRIFYIDVGNLPKMKAEQYLRDIMTRFKNKLVYDSNTGEIRDDRKFMTLLEDFWLPRREGGKGTEISTLPGGQNLGQIEDIKYFQENLYKSLNVPIGRLDKNQPYNYGGTTNQITREEVKFTRFVERLRLKFSQLFLKILEKQLVLKGIMSIDEFDIIKDRIKFKFSKDNIFEEFKFNEILMQRVNLSNSMINVVGKYFSHDWVRKNIFQQSEQDIKDQDKIIVNEVKNPILTPPLEPEGQ